MSPARWLIAGIALVAGAAVGGALDATLRPTKGIRTITRTDTATVVATVRTAASPTRPAPVPDPIPGDPNPHHLKLADAIPADAELTGAWYPAAQQLLVQWDRDFGGGAPYEELGLTLYEYGGKQEELPWHAVWILRRTERDGVSGLRAQVGDFTGDGKADFVVFVDHDGSAGAGNYRVYANGGRATRLVLLRPLSMDEGRLILTKGEIVVTRGVDFAGPGIHCCFRRVRTTVLGWDGTRLHTVSSHVGPNHGRWPPGA